MKYIGLAGREQRPKTESINTVGVDSCAMAAWILVLVLVLLVFACLKELGVVVILPKYGGPSPHANLICINDVSADEDLRPGTKPIPKVQVLPSALNDFVQNVRQSAALDWYFMRYKGRVVESGARVVVPVRQVDRHGNSAYRTLGIAGIVNRELQTARNTSGYFKRELANHHLWSMAGKKCGACQVHAGAGGIGGVLCDAKSLQSLFPLPSTGGLGLVYKVSRLDDKEPCGESQNECKTGNPPIRDRPPVISRFGGFLLLAFLAVRILEATDVGGKRASYSGWCSTAVWMFAVCWLMSIAFPATWSWWL